MGEFMGIQWDFTFWMVIDDYIPGRIMKQFICSLVIMQDIARQFYTFGKNNTINQ